MPVPAPESALALLVLGGEDPLHRPRSRAALHYYLACRARAQELPCLVLSGAGVTAAGAGAHTTGVTEAEGMAAYLVARGVAPTHVLQEPLARTTLANVVFGGALAAQHGLERVALVSDDFHLWRALRLYQRVWGCTPALCVASGARGSAYLRLREKAVFALQMAALQLAGVAPGNWRAHLDFVRAGTPPLTPPSP